MLYRLAMAVFLCAVAGPLFAFFAQPPGYVLSEAPQTSGTSDITWDPATGATDFYASHNGGIRRFDTVGNAFAATPLFTAPTTIAPAAFAFFDALAIDPTATDDFYVSYSGNFSRLYKLTRTGPDSSTVVTSVDYNVGGNYIFRLEFVPDLPTVPAALRGQLLASASVGFSGIAGIYVVDKTTLALTSLVEVTNTQSSGPLAIDSSGNVYGVVPTSFGTPTGVELLKFDATDVANAIGGTPVPATAGETLVGPSDDEWNISALATRDENGSTFLYYSTQEHASIFRRCIPTGETREFMQGFGGVADGFPAHRAVGGSISFSSSVDDFQPAGGGATTLAVPFIVSTVGFGSYTSVYFVDPEPVNAAVDSLVISQQPTDINNGASFAVSLQALNSSGTPLLSNVGVVVSVTGLGELHGFTVTSQPGDMLVVSGLVYTVPTLPETITLTFELAGNSAVSVTTTPIQVVPAAQTLAPVSPGNVNTSEFFSVQVELQDGAGQTVLAGGDSTREVTAIVTSGPGGLFGNMTVTAVNGVATFDSLVADFPGPYILEFSSPGLPSQSLGVSVDVQSSSSDSSSSKDESNGCVALAGRSSWLLIGLLALLGVGGALRRQQSA